MPDNEFVPRTECALRCQKLEDEDRRQNERLRTLESSIAEIHRLAVNTETLAVSIEQTVVELKEQGRRISNLEGRDGEKWRGVVKVVGTAVIGAVIGAILMMIGLK